MVVTKSAKTITLVVIVFRLILLVVELTPPDFDVPLLTDANTLSIDSLMFASAASSLSSATIPQIVLFSKESKSADISVKQSMHG